MSIDLILALALFLGASWIDLLYRIITITREHPAENTLLAVAFIHFVVLVYFFLAGSVLYGKSVKTVTGREWSRIAQYEEIFVTTWPAAGLSALLGILTTKLTGLVNPVVLILPYTLFGLGLLLWTNRKRHLFFLLAVSLLFVPYMWLMSLLCSNVNVSINQQYYKPGDKAIITVRSEGYVFNPSIKQVDILAGSYPSYQVPNDLRTNYVRLVQPITIDMETDEMETWPTYIRTIYTPQTWWFSREEYTEITIVP